MEKDGFKIKYYSNEDAAKKIAKDNGEYGIKFISTLPPTVIVPIRNK